MLRVVWWLFRLFHCQTSVGQRASLLTALKLAHFEVASPKLCPHVVYGYARVPVAHTPEAGDRAVAGRMDCILVEVGIADWNPVESS